MNELLTELERQAKRNMIKWHVGQQITCPSCGCILDCKRAIEVNVYGPVNTTTNERPLMKSLIWCVSCWEGNRNQVQIPPGYQFKINDGRVLFPPTPESSKARTPDRNPIHGRDVKIDGRYEIRHTSGFVAVRVLRKRGNAWSNRTGWDCLNEKTGREIHVKSAAKFRREIGQ